MLQEQQLVELAKQNWLETAVERDEKLVEYLFPCTRDATNASVLDDLQYLGLYLWPCYTRKPKSCSDLHILSIVNMVCESHKVTENVWNWVGDDEEEAFGTFFSRLLSLSASSFPSLDHFEQERRVFFLLLAFRRQDVGFLRRHAFSLISLPLFVHVSPNTRSKQFDKYPQLKRMWRKVETKRQACQQEGRAYLEADFIPFLASQVEKTLDEQILSAERRDDYQQYIYPLLYVERILELFIELLWQLPTRRLFCVFLNEYQLVVSLKFRLRKYQDWESLANLQSFVDMLSFYERFPIDNDHGEPLTREQLLLEYHDRILSLQKFVFKQVPKLKSLAVVGASQLTNAEYLSEQLEKHLSKEQLIQLAIQLECFPYRDDENTCVDDSLLLECIVNRIVFYPWKYETFYKVASNPTEKDIWDDTLTSLEEEMYLDEPLALPKLHLQYLSIGDFVLRHFTLFRMEAAYSIRQEMEDALERLNPCLGDMGRTQFRGWSRMMIPLENLSIYEKAPTRLDSEVAQFVKMDISYDLDSIPFDRYRQEWDQIVENDILFLLSIQKPMEEKESFIERYGVVAVRTFQVIGFVDVEGNEIPSTERQAFLSKLVASRRTLRGYVDATQFEIDQKELQGLYTMDSPDHFNLVMRRKPHENNFRGVLDTLKDIFVHCYVPKWLLDTLLGYGELESSLDCLQGKQFDLGDTFVSLSHMETCLKEMNIPFSIARTESSIENPSNEYWRWHFKYDDKLQIEATPYEKDYLGPFPNRKRNQVAFTTKQVEAILHGMKQGLSLVVGPPGTGKTDVAVQLISNLYHSFPEERILIVTHSNHALNDIFVKISQRDIDPKDILRLGHGEEELGLAESFSREGRVNYMLQKRLDDLQLVKQLAESLLLPGDYGYSCENALLLYHTHVLPLKKEFFAQLDQIQDHSNISSWIAQHFPFHSFFSQLYASNALHEIDLQATKGCFHYLDKLFEELESFRALELLRNQKERGDYVLLKQAKIIAMTCTHASIRRQDYVEMGLKYDTLIMEESAQVLEVETFIPMVLQKPDFGDDSTRLKRCILLGDHHQLPPVVKSRALAKYCNLQQSLYTRLLRLGMYHTVLDVQGRARPSIANIYRWCYPNLKDLTQLAENPSYQLANPGFRFEYQWISVGDVDSETQPLPYFYQNVVEAEWIAAVYQYMRLLGYPREKISILTTYRGQKELLKEVLQHRIAWNPSLGIPKVTTVDKYQGQQNEYVLLSLVRTKHVGYIRDVRRWVVATSRARLGLYIFGYLPLFQQYPGEWKQGLQIICRHGVSADGNSSALQLVKEERYPNCSRKLNDTVSSDRLVEISNCVDMAKYIQQLVAQDYSST